MSFTSILRAIIFNVGALAVAYVLLLSGVHKFTHKVGQERKEGRREGGSAEGRREGVWRRKGGV